MFNVCWFYIQVSHSSNYRKRGFLWQLLTEIAQSHGYASHEMSCQTDPVALPGINSIGLARLASTFIPPPKLFGSFALKWVFNITLLLLEEEFAKLDRKYAELSDEFKSKMVIEERLLSYQHQLDQRASTEIKLEVRPTSPADVTINLRNLHAAMQL